MVSALSAADQTATVDAAMPLADFRRELAEVGMALPLGESPGMPSTVGEALLFGLPHTLESPSGSWRAWLLGARIVLPDGSEATVGAKVVKSVAGYDLHKYLVGTRGELARFREATLRLSPLGALPVSVSVHGIAAEATHVGRCRRSDFEAWRRELADAVHLADPASSTIWTLGPPTSLPRDAWTVALSGPLELGVRDRRLRDLLGRGSGIL